MPGSSSTGSLESLWRFPVKSMQGEQLESAAITEAGLVGDRAYGVIDVESGKVASAKHPRKWAALLACGARYVEVPMAGQPAPVVEITLPDGTTVRSDGADIDRQLSSALGRPVHLAAVAPDGRTLEEVWPDVPGMAPEEFIASTKIGTEADGTVTDVSMGLAAPVGTFFDLAVLHLLTTGTLAHLATLYPDGRFDVRRYRPNLVLDVDGEGFVENDWPGHTLRVGDDVEVAVSIPTMRCVMTTMAQGDLPRDLDVLRTAARHNRVEIPGFGFWACTGAYAGVAAGGQVAVGDAVVVS